MAHHVTKPAYHQLVDRLNRFPQGAPPSMLLEKILGILFSEKEAGLVSQLPIKPFKAQKAAGIWKISRNEARKILNRLASRAILLDIEYKGETCYVLPPPMAGFFEFSLMRVRGDIDQKALSELFYQYLNVEEDFIKDLFTQGSTKLGRVFVHEPVLSTDNELHILDYERASEVIKSASHRGISTCYCRHKMYHVGKSCESPMEICMTFNMSAKSLIKYGHAREVGVSEGLDLLEKAYEFNLVQFGENVGQQVNFICNCCGCCCEALIAARRFAVFYPVHTTNFMPAIDPDDCTVCGKCVSICPVEAMTLVSANDSCLPKKKKVLFNKDICLGCGLCVRICSENSLELMAVNQRIITPLNGAHRVVVMAIERGCLHHMIFDNRVLFSHRALAAVVGVILKLPPMKKLLAVKQFKSRFLETLVSHTKYSEIV